MEVLFPGLLAWVEPIGDRLKLQRFFWQENLMLNAQKLSAGSQGYELHSAKGQYFALAFPTVF